MSEVLILGCGYLGRRLAAQLRARGLRVRGSTRSATKARALESLGIKPVVLDVLDAASVRSLEGSPLVVSCIGLDRSQGVASRDVYVEGLRRVLGRLSGICRVLVQASSTGVFGQQRGEWVDEQAAAAPRTASGAACLEAEGVTFEFGYETRARVAVLRYSGLYGPGRIIRRGLLERGEPVPGDPEHWLNLIHIDDAAGATVAALEADAATGVFLASDDRPVRRRKFYELMAAELGLDPPRFVADAVGSRDATNKRVSNRRLREELRFVPRYKDILTGLPAALAEEAGRPADHSTGAGSM